MSVTELPVIRWSDMAVPVTGAGEKLRAVTWIPASRACTMTSIAGLDTAAMSSWVAVAMPWRARTARMSLSRRAKELGSFSWAGSGP
jgi:hypothetical protein